MAVATWTSVRTCRPASSRSTPVTPTGAGRTAAQAALGSSATVTGASAVGVARQTKQEEEQSALAIAPAMSQAMTQPREAAARADTVAPAAPQEMPGR